MAGAESDRKSASLSRLRPRRLVWWLLGSARAGWAVRLRELPVLGGVVHAVSHRVWPKGRRDWFEVEAGLAEGLVLLLDPRFDAKFASGAVEPELQARIPQLVQRGSVVWDVGAHVGFFALALARIVGPDGRVVAFEADGVNVEALRAAAALNGLDNVEVRPVAVWSAPGTVEFQPRSASDGGHGAVVEAGGGVMVPATSLDAEAQGQRIPDLVKIDVEGAEEQVLIGARQLLADHRPIVICEVHVSGRGNEGLLPRVEALFEDAGYAVEQLDPGRRPVHLLATPS
jgi:FkbM family methyltransferase